MSYGNSHAGNFAQWPVALGVGLGSGVTGSVSACITV